MIYLLTLLIGIPFLMLVALYYSWAAAIMWEWFVVPIFHAPHLNVWQVWGICLTLQLFGPKNRLQKPENEEVDWNGWVAVFVSPLLALAIGWWIR